MVPYVWTHPVCLDAPMFGHHPYVWMPHMFGHHPYIWIPCRMFGCPPVCLVAPICVALLVTLFSLLQGLDAPICFDAPHVWTPPMFGCPPLCLNAHMFGYTPCMFECPHMFGYTPCIFECTHMFGWPPVCLNAPNVWTPHCMFGCPFYV